MQILETRDGKPYKIRILEPFDAHNHFRDKEMLRAVANFTAQRFPRGAVAMPNLPEPITTPELALNYKGHIQKVVGQDYPLIMTGYLTEKTDPDMVVRGFQSGAWQAMKFYPYGMTTLSHHGISDIKTIRTVLKVMEEIGMPGLFHGEKGTTKNNSKADIYDREELFYDYDAQWLLDNFPKLKMSFEHGSTSAFARFMSSFSGFPDCHVMGTVTPQHLLFDRNDFFANGPDVHLHCYPVLKRKEDKRELRELVTKGYAFIAAGTDSAPHPTHAKEKACGCAGGVFTAHAAPEMYAEVFEEEKALDKLEGFLSINGPRFYGLEPSKKRITYAKEPWTVDSIIEVEGGDKVRPLFYQPPNGPVCYPSLEDPAKPRQIKWKLVA